MTYAETYSWIFFALAKASEDKPVRLKTLEKVALIINRCGPNGIEVTKSIKWLKENALIENEGVKHSLTEKGLSIYRKIFVNQSSLSKQWELLTKELEALGADNKSFFEHGIF